jgi:prephenate dehydratase
MTPQSPLKIAIQGVRASFHDAAAAKHFATRTLEPVECSSFPLLATQLREKTADYAVMAIENSIAGSILPNYSLMEANGFKILGEVYLRIEMNLMALPGQKIEALESVQSHPMALLQCQDFLAKYPNLKVLEGADTAESAKIIHERQARGQAAIASARAAEVYGLEILAAGIETNKQNYTRFLVICRGDDYVAPSAANKASVRFELPHRAGSLADVLDIFRTFEVNMTKLQSVPILGRPYEYSFHVDLEWKEFARYEEALARVAKEAVNLIHFGNYPRGERPNL